MIPGEWLAQLAEEKRIRITVKAIPKASKNEIVWADGVCKVKVTAPPDKGKANAAVCELLAEAFDVPKSHVRVVRGETSHSKQIEIVLL